MKNLLKKRIKTVALCLGVVMTCSHPVSATSLCDFEGTIVVANQELDSMRGGFITTSGLEISISIIKAVVIDGVLQTVSQLNVPDLTRLSRSKHNARPGHNASRAVHSARAGRSGADRAWRQQGHIGVPPRQGGYPIVTTSNPTVEQTTDINTTNPVIAQPANVMTASPTVAQAANAITASPKVAQPAGVTTAGATAAPVNSATTAAVVEEIETPTITVKPIITINSKQTEPGTIVRNFGGPIAVQNSRNGVTIQNNMTINATTNSATLMQRMNLSSRITQQLIDSAYR